ncbi:MAG: amino acid ABC transporter permease [Clostridia bacterium]|nr:amino acid ABC transporter permease [Clostridia bacterium]
MGIKYLNNPEKLWNLIAILGNGVGVTVQIFLLTLILSIPLGMLVATGRMSRRGWVSGPISVYIYIMRGTPLMLQILFIYFLLPTTGPISFDRFSAAILAFTINYAAYFAEIFRGGIQSIPPGQWEAGQVLGMKKAQVFFRVVLPQVCKRVLLPVTNEVITLVKDTALASTIAVTELMSLAKKHVSSSTSIEPYLIAMLIYLLMNGITEQVSRWLEKKLSYYQ